MTTAMIAAVTRRHSAWRAGVSRAFSNCSLPAATARCMAHAASSTSPFRMMVFLFWSGQRLNIPLFLYTNTAGRDGTRNQDRDDLNTFKSNRLLHFYSGLFIAHEVSVFFQLMLFGETLRNRCTTHARRRQLRER
ncbi:hypothetical protein [Paraburkholderia tropica]|uniref:hypothetical protein n=1 Tax=Paraburkholderia tropica TaxID=92647 RepID=UPI001E59C738|nr:hypothetical protein [Paraburkholderia tropica]